MKTSTNINYRREDWPLAPISRGVQLVAGTPFLTSSSSILWQPTSGEPLQFPDKHPSEEVVRDKFDDVCLLAGYMLPQNTALIPERAPDQPS